MTDIQEQLKHHLDTGADWEKLETPVPGVYVVRIPSTKTRGPLLHLEINPLTDDGKPMKRRGLFVGSKEMLIKFGEALNDDKVFQLIGELEKINPKDRILTNKKLKM